MSIVHTRREWDLLTALVSVARFDPAQFGAELSIITKPSNYATWTGADLVTDVVRELAFACAELGLHDEIELIDAETGGALTQALALDPETCMPVGDLV